MQSKSMILARPIALAVGAALAFGAVAADAAPRKAKRLTATRTVTPKPMAGVQRPTGEVYLSIGRGQLVTLPVPIADVFVSNDSVADVRVQSPTQLYVFGKADGETSVYATSRNGSVVYSTNVRVAQNYSSLDQMLKVSLPESDIKVALSGQVAVLTGTVASPEDIANAENLTKALLNPGVNVSDPNAQLKVLVINRLKTATPLQVNLHVRIAEVSRSFSKNFGVRWQGNNSAPTGQGTRFGVDQGFNAPNGGNLATLSGRLLGLNILGQLDIGEAEGFVTTLASPNLTALSGETATFLAGGEIPVPMMSQLSGVTVTFKPYGVNLAFTPIVMTDGRISIRVKPEVSELDYQNAVVVNGFNVPGLSTRRAETTVELGSGQSFVIGGLLKTINSNNVSKTPGAGDIPVIGALFRSTGFRRGETELMIVVTPYLVNPVAANQIMMPYEGYKTPNDLERILGGEIYKGTTGERRVMPSVAPSANVVRPQIGAAVMPEPATPSTPARSVGTAASPGFSK
jgi:pilus assembly protein CpaC